MKLFLHYGTLEQLKASYEDLFNIKNSNEVKNVIKTLEYEYGDMSIEYLTQYECISQLKDNKLFGNTIASNVYGFYMGNDTCEHLIYSLKELKEIFEYINNTLNKGPKSSKKKTISLVTPSVGNIGIKRLIILFDYLSSLKNKTEIIVNDLGVLNLINTKYKDKLVPILGRMLNKAQRNPMVGKKADPQIPAKLGKEIFNKIQKFQNAYYEANPLTISIFEKSFEKLGINRFGVDFTFNSLEDIKDKKVDLYYPFSSIAHGRNCATRGIIEKTGEYYVQDKVCSRYCKDYDIILGDGTNKKGIVQRGNGVYKKYTNLDILNKEFKENQNNRMIFSPFIPL